MPRFPNNCRQEVDVGGEKIAVGGEKGDDYEAVETWETVKNIL
jgi:hypothetical protein